MLGNACMSAALIPIVHISILRYVRRPERTMHFMLLSFACAFVLWSISVIGAPLHVLIAGGALLLFLCMGYMEILFKLYRGFSYTILTDLHVSPDRDAEAIMAGFAEGVGSIGMRDRRIETMVRHHMIRRSGDMLTLTRKGTYVAHYARWYKHILHLGHGG